jgi:HupE / UreJ protein
MERRELHRAERLARWAVLAIVALGAPRVSAHGVGMSQLRLRVDGARAEGEWEIPVAAARSALGLDPAATGEASWRELLSHEVTFRGYLARQLALSADGHACAIALTPAPLEETAQSQVLIHLVVTCPAEPRWLALHCDLLFERDRLHRAYFSVDDARVTHVGLFRSDARDATLEIHAFHAWSGFVEFVHDGIEHIASGADHLLFLVALLLPAPLLRRDGLWSPRAGLGPTVREVLKVVSAFTLAHSVTLGLSTFGVITLPARLVEVTIALSVFLAAWNNLRPFLPGRAWVMALAFGLVHGLGFAGALRNLALPLRARGLALLAFNLGVELGQLALVVVILPVLYILSRRGRYPRFVMGAGSLAISWLAALWVLQRGFGISLLGHWLS